MGYKLFIIAPHFPPSALPPSQRVRLMVKHLADFDFETTIFTTQHKYREEIADEWMLELAGNKFKKIEVRSLPQKWTRKIRVGDLGLRWIPFLFPALLFKIFKEKPDFILYPVPPWYLLTIAPIIQLITGVKYGIDFIDPWVDVSVDKNAGIKSRMSQKLAYFFERRAVMRSSIIYSVSEGINNGLVYRYPEVASKPFYAISYGVEPDDFIQIPLKENIKKDFFTLRYIGAVWGDAYLVLETLLHAFGELKDNYKFRLEFYGTSYAHVDLATPQLTNWKEKFGLNNILYEQPSRVTYKEAVRLTMESDFLFLFGGMQPYYAASKLMGLLASKKLFIAFLHKNSFPAKILKEIKYPYLVLYSSNEGDKPVDHLSMLKVTLTDMFSNKKMFAGADFINNELLLKHTAKGMTEEFVKPIKELLIK